MNEMGNCGNFRENKRGVLLIRLAHLNSTGDLSRLLIEIYVRDIFKDDHGSN